MLDSRICEAYLWGRAHIMVPELVHGKVIKGNPALGGMGLDPVEDVFMALVLVVPRVGLGLPSPAVSYLTRVRKTTACTGRV